MEPTSSYPPAVFPEPTHPGAWDVDYPAPSDPSFSGLRRTSYKQATVMEADESSAIAVYVFAYPQLIISKLRNVWLHSWSAGSKEVFLRIRSRTIDNTKFSAVSLLENLTAEVILSVLEARYGGVALRLLPSLTQVRATRAFLPPREETPDQSAQPILDLDVLLTGDPNQAAQIVLAKLARQDIDPRTRDLLIVASERIRVSDATLREALGDALHQWACILMESGREQEQPMLWTAIRRSAGLGTPIQLGRLLRFLSPTAPAEVRQVALQAIANKCQRGPAPYAPGLDALRARVHEMAEQLVEPELLGIPSAAALAISVLLAATALGEATAAAFADAFVSFPLLATQLRREVERLVARWPAETRGEADSFVRAMSEGLDSKHPMP